MNWMNKMERKYGRYAIGNLTVYLLVCYAVGFLVSRTMPGFLRYLTLEPALILQGQVWRILTWIIIPPDDSLFFVFVLLLYYSLGRTLENAWGDFRYNLYIFSGMLFTIIGAFICYGIGRIGGVHILMGGYFSTYYINLSIFLACAAMMPDLQLWLMGILPVKMKWLAYLDVALLILEFLVGGIVAKISIVASMLNFILYFIFNRNMRRYSPKQVIRKQKFRREIQRPVNQYAGGAKHRCAVCGRTELDDPNLEFRYCSKCNGNYEYCQDHLFTHEHVK